MYRSMYLTSAFVSSMEKRYFRSEKLRKFQGKVAILGIDMQGYFLNPIGKAYLPSSPEFLNRIKRLYEFAKNKGIEIILTKHCHEGNILSKWWNDEMKCDDTSTAILEELRKYGNKIIEKNTYNAFLKTELEEYLKNKGVETLIITGVMTHLCCETTARDAFNRGFNVIFPIDGTITQNKELHECTLRSISHGFGVVISIERLLEWLVQK